MDDSAAARIAGARCPLWDMHVQGADDGPLGHQEPALSFGDVISIGPFAGLRMIIPDPCGSCGAPAAMSCFGCTFPLCSPCWAAAGGQCGHCLVADADLMATARMRGAVADDAADCALSGRCRLGLEGTWPPGAARAAVSSPPR